MGYFSINARNCGIRITGNGSRVEETRIIRKGNRIKKETIIRDRNGNWIGSFSSSRLIKKTKLCSIVSKRYQTGYWRRILPELQEKRLQQLRERLHLFGGSNTVVSMMTGIWITPSFMLKEWSGSPARR